MVELPDRQYVTRRNDPRLATGSVEFWDFASPFREPIRKQHLVRFRLVKKDPKAAVSEPVAPIVYYIDSAAPEPIRSALVEGASWWNQAFEAAGFKGGFQVKVLPPDVDPMDLRYNVILWMDRPSRGWSSGGYVTDPRTGEIIAGRVWLDAQRIRQDFLIGSALRPLYGGANPDTKDIEDMALARIRQLSAHEVGHTLGYGHNYASSAWGRASVMDYPHPLIKITDNGADALAELERVLRIRQIGLTSFTEKSVPVRTALARLEEVLVPLYLFHRYQTQAAAKSIGGINYRIYDESLPTVQEVIDTTLARTWKASPPTGAYRSEIHRAVDNVALYHLMILATDPQSPAQAAAIAFSKIDQLRRWLEERVPSVTDEPQRAHFQYAVALIQRYQADPARFVVPAPQATPPGAPIGTAEYWLPGMVWEGER